MLTRIHTSSLLKTFAKAIDAASRLGINYIWINSLCIFQDEIEDWKAEARQLEAVYRNRYLNLMASESVNSDGGLCRERDPEKVQSIFTSFWDGLERQTWTLLGDWLYGLEVNKAPLNNRSWVLQERVLAPRLLHFGRTQLIWECKESISCETHPGGLPREVEVTRSKLKFQEAWSHWDMPPDLARWWFLVESYNHTRLTSHRTSFRPSADWQDGCSRAWAGCILPASGSNTCS